jgi:N-acetyl-gamma-glutamylphosphate reductase
VRGVLDICHVFPERELTRSDVIELYQSFYADAPFVDVWDAPPESGATYQYRPYPWVSAVAGTNRCQLGFELDRERGRLVVLSVLDSLGKGGAHVGVENLNLMLGLPRTQGLERWGCHP